MIMNHAFKIFLDHLQVQPHHDSQGHVLHHNVLEPWHLASQWWWWWCGWWYFLSKYYKRSLHVHSQDDVDRWGTQWCRGWRELQAASTHWTGSAEALCSRRILKGFLDHKHLVVPNYRESRSLRCQPWPPGGQLMTTTTTTTRTRTRTKTTIENDKDKDNTDLVKLLLCTLARQSHPCGENNESDWNDWFEYFDTNKWQKWHVCCVSSEKEQTTRSISQKQNLAVPTLSEHASNASKWMAKISYVQSFCWSHRCIA